MASSESNHDDGPTPATEHAAEHAAEHASGHPAAHAESPRHDSAALAARLERAPLRVSPRLWVIGVYWLAQLFVVAVMIEVLFTGGDWDSLRFWERFDDQEERLLVLMAWGAIIAVQGAFLAPVPRPDVKRASSRPSWLRLVAGGLALSMLVVLPAWACCFLVFERVGDVLDSLLDLTFRGMILVFGGAWLGLGGVITLLLARRCRDGMPLMLSVFIAGAMCAALAGGAVLLATSVWDLLTGWLKIGIFDPDPMEYVPYVLAAVVLAAWAVSTPLLWAFIKGKPSDSALQRIASRLFVGTVIEVIVIIPFDVMVRRKTSCYCGEGTFWALVWCGTVGAVLVGPLIYLAPFGKRRRRLLSGMCPGCGYDMKATPSADRCPECGLGWSAAA
jgi:hypothetical protein